MEVEKPNMLKFFGRPVALGVQKQHCRSPSNEGEIDLDEPIPVAEVVEGNEDVDWRLWVSAVVAQSKVDHEAQVRNALAAVKRGRRPASIADYVRLDWYREH
jgi:hypothetical protein